MTKSDSKKRPPAKLAQTRVQTYKTLALVVVVVNAVLVVFVFLVSIRLHQEGHPSPCEEKGEGRVETQEELTRYCFDMAGDRCLEEGREVKVVGNRTVCCGGLVERIFGLISEELPERFRSDAAKAAILDQVKRYMQRLQTDPSAVKVRTAAHVGILLNGNLTGPDSEVPRIHWEESGDRSFLSGGVIHGGDRLTISKAGYYYVYTGLQFDVDSQTAESGAIASYLYRHVNGTKESRRKLMMTRESSCRLTRNGTSGPVSTHMAGIFLLRQGDEISIRTSAQSLLHRSSATTYMGLHMV